MTADRIPEQPPEGARLAAAALLLGLACLALGAALQIGLGAGIAALGAGLVAISLLIRREG